MNEKVLRHKEICDGLNELYASRPCPAFPAMTAASSRLRMSPFVILCSILQTMPS